MHTQHTSTHLTQLDIGVELSHALPCNAFAQKSPRQWLNSLHGQFLTLGRPRQLVGPEIYAVSRL